MATVWAVAWIFVCLTFGWVALLATSIVSAQHHLDGAADLASLSGGARLQRGGDPCGVAQAVARANRVELDHCETDGEDVVVDVSSSVQLPFGMSGRITARARAGP